MKPVRARRVVVGWCMRDLGKHPAHFIFWLTQVFSQSAFNEISCQALFENNLIVYADKVDGDEFAK